jgi:hypothetical protein
VWLRFVDDGDVTPETEADIKHAIGVGVRGGLYKKGTEPAWLAEEKR